MTTAEEMLEHADALETLLRLAEASGIPEGRPVIPWLLERGLIVKLANGGYALTAKAGPRAVE